MSKAKSIVGGITVFAAAAVIGLSASGDSTSNYYVAPSGFDSTSCSEAAPCRQISRALLVAGPNSVIHVKNGDYDGFPVVSEKDVTVQGEGSGTVIQNSVSVQKSSDLTFKNLKGSHATGFVVWDVKVSPNVRFENVELDGGQFRSRGSDGMSVVNSYVHDNPTSPEATNAFGANAIDSRQYGTFRSSHLLISHLKVERIHSDGVHISYTDGARVENSSFRESSPAGSGDHTDVIQVIRSKDVEIVDNRAIEWAHGILLTDYTTVDGPDQDDRAMTVTGNMIQTTSGYAWNGPPGKNSVISGNYFATKSTANAKGISMTNTIKPDLTLTSEGAKFTNNVVRGNMGVSGTIFEDWNMATTGKRTGSNTVYGLE